MYIPPWAGGEAPFEATKPRMTRAPVGLLPADPVAEGGDRHVSQLFRLLRHRKTKKEDGKGWRSWALRSPARAHGILQLVHQPRHRSIEDLHCGSSPNCSMARLGTRSCRPGGSARLAGRLPPGSSSYRLKSTGWGGGGVRNLAVYFVSLSSSPALAFLCPREEWCNDVATAAAINYCSCRHHERSRRCCPIVAAPETRSAIKSTLWVERLVVVVVVVVFDAD